MNYAFKAFFAKEEDAEVAYYILRKKNGVTDISISNLNIPRLHTFSAKIAYALEGNTLLASSEVSNNISSATILGTNDPRVAMMPVLFNKKQTSYEDVCFLYGHCRKKDISNVISCLKRNGAFSVLSSEVSRKPSILN